jgi:hypothetical protein
MHIVDECGAPRGFLAQCIPNVRSSIGIIAEDRICGFAFFLVQHILQTQA